MGEIRLCAFADEASENLEGQIKALRRNGIGLIELRGVDGVNVSEITHGAALGIGRRLSDEGIDVWSVGSPVGKTRVDEDFGGAYDGFCRILDTAVTLGAKCIRLFSFYGTGGRPEYRDEVLLRLSRFVDAARGSGVRLCHENEKGIYGDTAARCAEIHSALPEVCAVFDPANFVQCREDTVSAWNILAPYIYYGHVKDADREGRVVPAGDGAGNIREYLRCFSADGHEVLTLEPHLAKFVGLAALEGGDDRAVGGISFGSNDEAFDFAAARLRDMLGELKKE